MENIKFKDVAHFYVGCKIKNKEFGFIDILTGTKEMREYVYFDSTSGSYGNHNINKIIPILLPLSTISQQNLIDLLKLYTLCDLSECTFVFSEKDEAWCNAVYKGEVVDSIRLIGDCVELMNNDGSFSGANPQSKAQNYLLSKRFDLFNLIPQGEAIDATTCQPNPYSE